MDLTRCQTLIVTEAIWPDLLEYHLKKNQDLYYWVVSAHKNTHVAEDMHSNCHRIAGSHYHIVLWWRDNRYFTDLAIVSFLRRQQSRRQDPLENREVEMWTHQKVRNLKSILLYISNPPRTVLHGDSFMSSDIEEMLGNLPLDGQARMNKYIEKRDGKETESTESVAVAPQSNVAPVRKVDLQTVIEFIREDGCSNFDEWQKVLFKYHSHGSVQRKALVQIMQHPRSDKLIMHANDYMMNDVLSMDWYDSIDYKRKQLQHDIDNGGSYDVDDSAHWIRVICRNNGLKYRDFCDSVCNVMMKKNAKVNTLFLCGQSNAGKSKIARSIVNGMVTYGQVTRSETFLFMDCVDKQVILQEEIRITQDTVDNFKLVFEGSKLKVDVKNKQSRELGRTPVIACSNTPPWHWVMTEEQPLRNRMDYYFMTKCDKLRDMCKEISPLFWYEYMHAKLVIEAEKVNVKLSPKNQEPDVELDIFIPESPEVIYTSEDTTPSRKRKLLEVTECSANVEKRIKMEPLVSLSPLSNQETPDVIEVASSSQQEAVGGLLQENFTAGTLGDGFNLVWNDYSKQYEYDNGVTDDELMACLTANNFK